jgi:hypothetical protein
VDLSRVTLLAWGLELVVVVAATTASRSRPSVGEGALALQLVGEEERRRGGRGNGGEGHGRPPVDDYAVYRKAEGLPLQFLRCQSRWRSISYQTRCLFVFNEKGRFEAAWG